MTTAIEMIEGIDALPPLPGTTQRLMAIVGEPNGSLDDVVDIIKHDQAMTSQVLKLCNSASSGVSRKIGSLREAIGFLGTKKVFDLAIAAHTGGMLSKQQVGYDLEAGAMWRQSVAVAVGSAAIAKHLRLQDAHLLFTAGLLHDIGKVVLSEHVAESYAEILRLVTDEKLSFIEAEHRVLGFSHEEVGALVAERWQLPEAIVRCIRYHHDPFSLAVPDPLVDAVYLASTVCLMIGIGGGADGLSYRADQSVLDRHGLDERDLELIAMQMLSGLQEAELFMQAPASE